MIDKRTWDEFQNTGLLMFVNTFLHIFGWAICLDLDENTRKVKEVFPARTKFRGFGDESQDRAYRKVSNYMRDHADDLVNEVEDNSNYLFNDAIRYEK